MENKNLITEKTNQLIKDDFNKIEWINYFNEELIIESINNQINHSKNNNQKINSINNINRNKNQNIKTNIISINENIKNKEIMKAKKSSINKELYEKKNYYFSNIKVLFGTKKFLSFEYQEKINSDNLSGYFNLNRDKNNKNLENNNNEDFKNRKYKNIIIIENAKGKLNNKEKRKVNLNEKKNNSKDDFSNINGEEDKYYENIKTNKRRDNKNYTDKKINNYRNKNYLKNNLSHWNNLRKKKDNKNNNNNLKYNYMNDYPKYDWSSYAMRHKMEKNIKIDGHFHPNEEKPIKINKNLFFGRTLPEMIVLNNYGLVSDIDCENYQNMIENYKKNNL